VQALPGQQARSLHVALAPQLHQQTPKTRENPPSHSAPSGIIPSVCRACRCSLGAGRRAPEKGSAWQAAHSCMPWRMHACHRHARMHERLMRTCISLGFAPGASGEVRRSRLRLPALLPSTTATSPPPKSATCPRRCSGQWTATLSLVRGCLTALCTPPWP
jgi:hypothetical protein